MTFVRTFMDKGSLLDQVLKSLRTFFGSLDCPNFAIVQEVYDRNPHRKLITQLMDHFRVEDVTDLNTDVAVVLSLEAHNDKSEYFRIELSLVDKFVALFAVANEKSIILTAQSKDSRESYLSILKLLEKESYTLIPTEILETPIPFNRPNSNGISTVYNALFSDADFPQG